METIEFKPNKTATLVVILVFICCVVFSIWGISLPDVEIGYKVILAAGILLFIYQSRRMLIAIDDPILVLTKTTIQVLHENKHSIYLWSDILDYNVRVEIRDNDIHEYLLTIQTKAESKTFKINGVVKKPEELKQVIDGFRE